MASFVDFILELTKLASVGIASGVFGAFLALRRHRHEKWWEMRANAYKKIIERLSDITAVYEARNANWELSPCEPEEVRKEIAIANNEIRKHKDMGAFLLSKAAEAALTEFVEFKINDAQIIDPSDIYGPYSRNARTCLEKIVALSKKDLSLS